MKILLINDYANRTGGAEIMTLTLREGLRERGHDARLFACSAKPQNRPIEADYQCFGTLSSARALLEVANLSAYWRLRQVLAAFKPDIVHVRMFLSQISPLILPLLKNIPCLYHVVSPRSLCPQGTKLLPNGAPCSDLAGFACYQHQCLPLHSWLPHMVQLFLWRRWLGVFNSIVTNSAAMKVMLVANGIKPVEVIWNGIPLQAVRPALQQPPTIVFAGRLSSEKGVDILLHAFSQVVTCIPQAQLVIAGDGAAREHIAALIIELNLQKQVVLLGMLSHADMATHFAQGWVQVVPSKWAEPFGIVATEAMMRGMAVIASNGGGLAEIVQHEVTGLLVPPADVEKLAEALLTLLDNRQLAEQMGKAGRERALAEFSDAIFIDKFIALYEKILA